MKIRTEEELNYLLNKVPRIFWNTENHPCNYLKGLYNLIQENLKKTDIMVEVGSCAAVSTHLFAENVNTIYCVDLWQPYGEIDEDHIKECERLFDNFLKKYNNAIKVKKSSNDACTDFEDQSLDFVYLDADHTYEAVIQDIKNWLPKIKKTGAIAGHDYHHNSVQRAVFDSFKTHETPKIYDDFSWYIKLEK